MFIIVQNTVKRIVISIYDQISQTCLVGSTVVTVLNECLVGQRIQAVGGRRRW